MPDASKRGKALREEALAREAGAFTSSPVTPREASKPTNKPDEDVTAALLFGLFMGLLFGAFTASVMWWALG